MPHWFYIVFLFALGACVGSFLNVVVWRMPRGQSLITPPSHCPKCRKTLAWYDNLPVIGWIKLGGKCRHCRAPISPRYPIVEAVTGGLFVLYYAMFFMAQIGPCATCPVPAGNDVLMRTMRPALSLAEHWPIYGLYMFLISALLASSLIDAELFIIPVEICWVTAAVGMAVHAVIDVPCYPGALNASAASSALAAGGAAGLLVSIVLWFLKVLPTSFPEGEPLLEVDRAAMLADAERARREGRESEHPGPIPPAYDQRQIRAEMRKEMLFLLPPMLGAIGWWLATSKVASIGQMWEGLVRQHWVSGLLGSVLGALVGALVVWVTRILGTLGFGRVAMGLGDVHLMFGVGAVVGAGAATVAFFIAPFFGLALAVWMIATGTRRELPYGPYLSLATATCLLFYCDIAAYLRPGMEGLMIILGGGGLGGAP